MQLDHYVHTLGRHLKTRFGERVHKLALHAGFTCPNRDGTIGRGGCAFCNVASFSEESADSLEAQLTTARSQVERARRYLAYFQSYTNTYAEIERLRSMYEAALDSLGVVGLCVGTRPDCVPDAVLDLLASYQAQGSEVWLELGLQSTNDATLQAVNRGHGFAAYAETVARAQQRGVPVCAHLIVGLPGEEMAESLQTLARVLDVGVQGLKLHPLMIVRGSRMAADWREGKIIAADFDEYVAIASEMIRQTPAEVVFHRVSASARVPTLLAPDWCHSSQAAHNAIGANLARFGGQGAATARPYLIGSAGA